MAFQLALQPGLQSPELKTRVRDALAPRGDDQVSVDGWELWALDWRRVRCYEGEYADLARRIQSQAERTRIDQPRVWRGHWLRPRDPEPQVGNTYTVHVLLSVALGEVYARRFIEGKRLETWTKPRPPDVEALWQLPRRPYLFVFEDPRGVQCVQIQCRHASIEETEERERLGRPALYHLEALLPAGAKYRVVSIERPRDGAPVVRLRAVGKAGKRRTKRVALWHGTDEDRTLFSD